MCSSRYQALHHSPGGRQRVQDETYGEDGYSRVVGDLVPLIQSVTDLHLLLIGMRLFLLPFLPLHQKSSSGSMITGLSEKIEVAEGEVKECFSLYIAYIYYRSGAMSSRTTFQQLKYKSNFVQRALYACVSISRQELIQT